MLSTEVFGKCKLIYIHLQVLFLLLDHNFLDEKKIYIYIYNKYLFKKAALCSNKKMDLVITSMNLYLKTISCQLHSSQAKLSELLISITVKQG